jgi:hypothetical protein
MRALQSCVALAAALLLMSLPAPVLRGQEPASPAPASPPATPPPRVESSNTPSSSSNKHARNSHANDFLIIGTVFTDKAFAFPGVHLRIRRAAEKRFRWETYTNSRGEFAIRIPQGAEYEIVVVAKGFIDQNKTVSAKSGISEDDLVFQMQSAAEAKK